MNRKTMIRNKIKRKRDARIRHCDGLWEIITGQTNKLVLTAKAATKISEEIEKEKDPDAMGSKLNALLTKMKLIFVPLNACNKAVSGIAKLLK